jgi:glycosyltransferase involved in cell wall biosynthesis
MNKKFKVAYCTISDPRDLRSWSGIPYFIMSTLSEISDLDILGPLPNKWRVPVKIVNKILYTFLGKRFDATHIPIVCKEYTKQFNSKLKNNGYDFIIGAACSEVFAYLKTDIPIIYITDTTFAAMIDYYSPFLSLFNKSKQWGIDIERRTIENSSFIVYSSDWVVDSAVNIYDCPKDKFELIPFGANIKNPASEEEIIELRRRKIEKIKLLWVGVEWERKGGQIAYDTMVEMNNRGYESELIVCGVTLRIKNPHKGLRCEGFLDKNNPAEDERLQEIYKKANVFIMPTKQECAGIVFSEASAYGMPILTYDTGGVSNYVENGSNGYRLPLSASSSDFADKLEEIISTPELYSQMSINAFNKYVTELNRNTWMSVVKNRIELLSANKKPKIKKLPNFFVAGCQKAATTSLHYYLKQHPNIYLPNIKETKHFVIEERYSKGLSYYSDTYFSEVRNESAIGEVDPDYIYFKEALIRTKEHFNISLLKFIFIFRNPVDRAFSHYLMTYRRGLEAVPFSEAIALEPERIATDFFSKMHYSYVDRGFYYKQLIPFLEVLQPEQMLFLLTDDLERDRKKVLEKCFDFLCLDNKSFNIETQTDYHPAMIPKSSFILNEIVRKQNTLIKKFFRLMIPNQNLRHKLRERILEANLKPNISTITMKNNDRQKLVELYRDDNRKLSELIHQNLDHWNQVD